MVKLTLLDIMYIQLYTIGKSKINEDQVSIVHFYTFVLKMVISEPNR